MKSIREKERARWRQDKSKSRAREKADDLDGYHAREAARMREYRASLKSKREKRVKRKTKIIGDIFQ